MHRKNGAPDARTLAQSALFAALLCVLSPLAVPVGPVPVTLAVFAVLLTGIVLEWRRAGLAVLTYMLIGLVGLPVFSGGGSGFGVFAGPTGGYLWCYPLMAVLVSVVCRRWKKNAYAGAALGSMLALMLCYFTGTMQFALLMNCSVSHAVGICVWPFIGFDILKTAAAAFLGVRIRARLQMAGLLE